MVAAKLMSHKVFKRFRLRRRLSGHGTQLQEVSQGLLSLASQSEQEFLSLGERLQQFASTFKHLSQKLKRALQKLDGNGSDNEAVLASIRHLLESAVTVLDAQRENMASSLEHMMVVSERLQKVSKLREDFQKISRLLHILGTSIRIESNRAGKQGHEFMVLGDEIDQIWSHITKNTEVLLNEAAKSANLIETARKHITESWMNHQVLISGARKSILSVLTEVEEMYRISSGAAQGIADRTQAISQEIGEIVCSLQFHDITRQQLEHIHDALNRAGSGLKDSSHHEALFLHNITQTLLVQRSQLKNVSREIDQVGGRIRKSLTEIANKLEREDTSISYFHDNTHSLESGKVQLLENEISQLASILDQCKGLEEEISQALKPTIQSAAQIESYMQEMERVGYTINLLSLNALIKAAQNSESGQTFAVLAEEIHRQAIISAELSENARLGLSSLIDNNDALEKTLGFLIEQKSKAESIVRQTLENAASLGSLNQELGGLVSVLRRKNSQLASGLFALAQNIQFESLFRTRINQGLGELENIQNEIQEFLKSAHLKQPDKSHAATATELIDAHYTMEEERRIHQAAISGTTWQEGDEQKDEPKDELKGELRESPEKAEKELPEDTDNNNDKDNNNEEPLGDNVELF
ncbi:MAG: methyl-accepting chemotaxis protein [bacterium]